MNDDSSPSSSYPPRQTGQVRPLLDANVVQTPSERASLLRTRAHAQGKKRREYLNNLMRSLDIVIYCEFSILYYMDCSFFRFLLRSLIQLYYLTPKPPFVPEMPRPSPYIGAIFGTNIICFILHVFYPRPKAGEATRGYLHGGMMIDFVGQQGPTSKWHLVLLDGLILALQLVMLAVLVERRTLEASSTASADSTAAADMAAVEQEDVAAGQDHDSEERGVFRTEPTTTEDIELADFSSTQPADSTNQAASLDVGGERAELLAEPQDASHESDHPLDVFHSGEVVVADLHLLDTIQSQWRAYENRAAEQTDTSSARSSATAAASWAGSRLGIRVRVGGQPLG